MDGYGPGYYSGPAYYSERGYYAGNGYVGDYQEHRYWQDRDINNDACAIRQGQANIRHDKRELREDLENSDYSAAGPRASGNPAASCERKSQKGGSERRPVKWLLLRSA
jgi:hypothetical protein